MNSKIMKKDKRPLSEFRSKAAALIEEVRETKRPIIITRRGKSAAVLLGVYEYEALLEKLEILQDVREAEAQLREGKGVEHAQARRHVLARLQK